MDILDIVSAYMWVKCPGVSETLGSLYIRQEGIAAEQKQTVLL